MKISLAAITEAISVLTLMGKIAQDHVDGHGTPQKDLAALAKRCVDAAQDLQTELEDVGVKVERR